MKINFISGYICALDTRTWNAVKGLYPPVRNYNYMNQWTLDPFSIDECEFQSDSVNGNFTIEGCGYDSHGNAVHMRSLVEPKNIVRSVVIQWLSLPKNANETLHFTLSDSFPGKRVYSTVMVLNPLPEYSNQYSVVYFEIIKQLLQPSGADEFNDLYGKLCFIDHLSI